MDLQSEFVRGLVRDGETGDKVAKNTRKLIEWIDYPDDFKGSREDVILGRDPEVTEEFRNRHAKDVKLVSDVHQALGVGGEL